MSRFCSECGSEMNKNDLFCPNCGKKVDVENTNHEESYEDLIKSIVYIDDGNGDRISKAKMIGVLFALAMIIVNAVFNIPMSLRMGASVFFINVFACFIACVFYYFVCVGLGYVIRTFVIK